ncbi:MAG: hypothetical protein R3194_02040 [Limnobacter sp.]|nr:hypothetical protein [Limnobacter sp.]
MKEFDSVENHFFSQQVTDQWIIDRLFSYDLRMVEVKQAVHVFLNGRDDKDLQKYIRKFKNPNKKGSGGTYCQNPMRNNKELALLYTVLGNQVVQQEANYRAEKAEDAPLAQGQRLMLLATLSVWESYNEMEFIQRKKVRLIDLIAVMTYYLQGDWELSKCSICSSVGSKIDGISTPCPVCQVQQEKKAALRQQQAKDAVRI